MNGLSFDTIFSGLMGFVGGLFTIPLNSLFTYLLKREELTYTHKLALIAKKKELLLQHKLEMVSKHNENSKIGDLITRLEQLEKRSKDD